jgi:Ca2+:H+ antiporter
VTRRILFGLLGLGPAVVVLDLLGAPDMLLFLLAAAALIPLAWLIGEATEHAAHHTGPGVGGFLNATFGNAPELIIALFAVHEGLTEVVRGSLTGSVIGNLLLVLGFSLLFGGKGELDRESSFISFGLVGLATLLFLIPSIPGWHGDPERHQLARLSLPISIFLLLVYVAVTWYTLRRHRQRHVVDESSSFDAWSLPVALLVLAGATVVTAFVAEILVHTLETFAEKAHLTDFFVAAVIVAIVGNAAEHGGAVVVAARSPSGPSRSRYSEARRCSPQQSSGRGGRAGSAAGCSSLRTLGLRPPSSWRATASRLEQPRVASDTQARPPTLARMGFG